MLGIMAEEEYNKDDGAEAKALRYVSSESLMRLDINCIHIILAKCCQSRDEARGWTRKCTTCASQRCKRSKQTSQVRSHTNNPWSETAQHSL